MYRSPMATVVRSEASPRPEFGELLREWRRRRHQSQLALALDAGVSQRHLSFVESGRAQPSREMVLRLAEQLDVPLRERNRLLVAAGYAPVFQERSLDDPALGAVHRAIERVLRAHEPYPALAIDRHWTLVAANRAVAPFLAAASPALLTPPVNVLRLSLHPDGLAPRIANLSQWRPYLLQRLQHESDLTGDPQLDELLTELRGYPTPRDRAGSPVSTATVHADSRVFVPLQLETDAGVLSFLSTTTVFGTPVDVTVAEIALECFFPADDATAEHLRRSLGG
jgi:transcriptional regulator with XRE-family HTH domain